MVGSVILIVDFRLSGMNRKQSENNFHLFRSFLSFYHKICEEFEELHVFLLKTCWNCLMIARKWAICKNLYWMHIKMAPSQSGNGSIVIFLTLNVPPALVNRFLTPNHFDTCPGFGKVSQSYGIWQSYTPTVYCRIWWLHKDHLILQNLTFLLNILCFQSFETISFHVSFLFTRYSLCEQHAHMLYSL